MATKVNECSTLEAKQAVSPKQQLIERSRAFLNEQVSKELEDYLTVNASDVHCTNSLVVFSDPAALNTMSGNGATKPDNEKSEPESENMESDSDTSENEDMESEITKAEPVITKAEPVNIKPVTENAKTKPAVKKTRGAKNANAAAAKVVTGYSCTHCVKSFTNKKALNKHVRMSHKPMEIVTLPKKPTHKAAGKIRHQCEECEKDFSRADHLRRHSLIHSGIRPHPCPVCDRQFARKDKLTKHLLGHPRDTVRAAQAALA